jgi:hypothetical protein
MMHSHPKEDAHPRKPKVVFFGIPSHYALRPLEAVTSAHEVDALVVSAPRGSQASCLGLIQKMGVCFLWFFWQPSLWVYAHGINLPYFYC